MAKKKTAPRLSRLPEDGGEELANAWRERFLAVGTSRADAAALLPQDMRRHSFEPKPDGASTMTATNWRMSGEYMESCNCDYLCPCIYTNPQGEVTHDQCTALMVYRIDSGQCGATPLDGLHFALIIRSGKVMADGNWIFACVVDERADDAQRAALDSILKGEAGGRPAMIQDNLVGDFRGVAYASISFEMNDLDRSSDVGDIFSFAISGVASRTGSGLPISIDNTAHPANSRLALARTSEMHLHAFGLDLDMSGLGNNGHFAPFDWTN